MVAGSDFFEQRRRRNQVLHLLREISSRTLPTPDLECNAREAEGELLLTLRCIIALRNGREPNMLPDTAYLRELLSLAPERVTQEAQP